MSAGMERHLLTLTRLSLFIQFRSKCVCSRHARERKREQKEGEGEKHVRPIVFSVGHESIATVLKFLSV